MLSNRALWQRGFWVDMAHISLEHRFDESGSNQGFVWWYDALLSRKTMLKMMRNGENISAQGHKAEELALNHVIHFKNHVATAHKIDLQPRVFPS